MAEQNTNKINLTVETYRQAGDLANTYAALQNVVKADGTRDKFDVDEDEFKVDLAHPINIECQPSYDGTVNLIINDDVNPPRIVNTRFSKIEDNKYKIIERNQIEQTNLYKKGEIDRQTRLFRNISKIPSLDLINIYNMGQLKGGNYTFYVRFSDADYNKTDFVCESGQVSVFKGLISKPESISGTLVDEKTDKAVSLRLSNIDESFSYVYVYYNRETSDLHGIRYSECGMFKNPYPITGHAITITLNGYEETIPVSEEELNLQYNIVTAAKTQAQVQNMLFFGNVQNEYINVKELQNFSYFLQVTLKQGDSLGWVSEEDYSIKNDDTTEQTEYYSPTNIYYKLGYWPEEIYRLGIVYIMADDSLTPVFNLRGCKFDPIDPDGQIESTNGITKESVDELLNKYTDEEYKISKYLERDCFLDNGDTLANTFGVFRNPKANVIDYHDNKTKPLYYEMKFDDRILDILKKKFKVKGFFIVRQKRIPTILAQGFTVGVDNVGYVPALYDNNKEAYFTESFLNDSRGLTNSFSGHITTTKTVQSSGLLVLDAMCNPELQANFDGSEYVLDGQYAVKTTNTNRHFYGKELDKKLSTTVSAELLYVNSDVPIKSIKSSLFSTRAGIPEDVSQFGYFGKRDQKATATNLIRGIYTPFVGCTKTLEHNAIYNIKIPGFTEGFMKNYFTIRANDQSPYFAISKRYAITDDFVSTGFDVFGGDCYTNTVTIRMQRNFTDPEVPVSDMIVAENTWSKNYKGVEDTRLSLSAEEQEKGELGDYSLINRADVNTVALGHWITFKCLSNYNLGLRAEDRTNTEEMSLIGNTRSFYPLRGIYMSAGTKLEESWLLNSGYSATVGKRRSFIVPNVPYVQELFDNRIMFSKMAITDSFENGYRIFQGLSYQDIDRQYGAIVKLLPWGQNLFCVFEHGIGIVPVNEKALIQTTSQQSIHLYGTGVLQNQISVISADFGTIWPESIVRTPRGVYGVDTYAKRIWRYTDGKGIETISDGTIQSFLNENIKLFEADKYPIIGIRNVKTHYNNYKGDVIFTFYNEYQNAVWSICYNERKGAWTTRYSWIPLCSENIDNVFFSLDQKRASLYGYVYNNLNCNYGLRNSTPKITFETDNTVGYETEISIAGIECKGIANMEINSIKTSRMENGIEKHITLDNSDLFTVSGDKIKIAPYSKFVEYFNNDVPIYYLLDVNASGIINNDTNTSIITNTIALIFDTSKVDTCYETKKKQFLQNGFFVHGRAGIFNEIDYTNDDLDNIEDDQILPCKWYGKQEPFEFEFVVNGDIGLHKIFDNLVIISNNVKPSELEFEISGDVFDFNKAGIFKAEEFNNPSRIWDTRVNKPKVAVDRNNISHEYQATQEFAHCKIKWDHVLNSYSLLVNQTCKDIKTHGRRLGNIEYKEDSWYLTIEPIVYKEQYCVDGKVDPTFRYKSARIRDKFAKIRVKYTGEDLVIITALKTLLTQSFA